MKLSLTQWQKTLFRGRPAVYSGEGTVPASGSGSASAKVGDRPVIVERVLINATIADGTDQVLGKATLSVDGEPIVKDATPITSLAAKANGHYAGIPPFVAGANATVICSYTDASGVETTIQLTLICREVQA